MKVKTKLIVTIIAILILIALIIFTVDYFNKYTLRAVVVRVHEKALMVIGIDNNAGLLSVGYSNFPDIEFKPGQEILIHYSGMIQSTYPGSPYNVTKIRITKEKSDVTIPENILRYCYSSRDNVKISISEIANTKISLTITDTNELAYTFSNDYTLRKLVKNENYTGIGHKIGENTDTSLSGYTRNRF